MAEQRYQAVLAVISDGLTISQVAEKVGVSRQTLHAWLARYEAALAAAASASSCEWVYIRAVIEASAWPSHLAMTASGTPRRCIAVLNCGERHVTGSGFTPDRRKGLLTPG